MSDKRHPHPTFNAHWRLIALLLALLAVLAPLPALPAHAAGSGRVVAWGLNNYGQTNVPTNLSGVNAIAAGDFHTVALKSDGTVVAWGDNDYGQTTVPTNLSGVNAIAAGGFHTVTLKSDGTVVAWGFNNVGQTSVPTNLSGITAIAAGFAHTVALKSDGTVVAWGFNNNGQTNVPVNLGGVTAIAAGTYHTVALKSDGTVVAWGRNAEGQTNVPSSLSGVTAIAAGANYTVALKSDGTVVTWGDNNYGQLSVPVNLSSASAIAAGGYHTVVIGTLTDITPPVITANVVGTQGRNGWYTSDVSVSWTVSDPESTVTSTSGCDPTSIIRDTTGTTLTCIATSVGGSASQQVTIKRDATMPVVAVTGVTDGASYTLGAVPEAACTTSDATSGVESPATLSLMGGSGIGLVTATCSGATDNAGNVATASAGYSVAYGFGGFSAPVDNPPVVNSANAGRSIPLKWRLTDANGNPVANLSGVTVTVASLACSASAPSDALEEYATSASGLQNLGNGYYQFNWATPKSYAGSCKTLKLDLGEGAGQQRTALFQFK